MSRVTKDERRVARVYRARSNRGGAQRVIVHVPDNELGLGLHDREKSIVPQVWPFSVCSASRTPISRAGITQPGKEGSFSRISMSSGSPSWPRVDGMKPKSKGKVRPRGKTLLSRHNPLSSSYLYLLREPPSVSTTTLSSPDLASRAGSRLSSVSMSPSPFEAVSLGFAAHLVLSFPQSQEMCPSIGSSHRREVALQPHPHPNVRVHRVEALYSV